MTEYQRHRDKRERRSPPDQVGQANSTTLRLLHPSTDGFAMTHFLLKANPLSNSVIGRIHTKFLGHNRGYDEVFIVIAII